VETARTGQVRMDDLPDPAAVSSPSIQHGNYCYIAAANCCLSQERQTPPDPHQGYARGSGGLRPSLSYSL
jgi:hypothetical protein